MEVTGWSELRSRLRLLSQASDAERIALLATQALDSLRRTQEAVSAARDTAVLEMHRAGCTLHQIATSAGLTRARVHQIVRRHRAES